MTVNSEDQKMQAKGIRDYLESNIDQKESESGKKQLLFLFHDAQGDLDKI